MANVVLTRGRKVEHVSGNWRMCDLLQRWTASGDSSRGQQMSDSDAMLALPVGKVVNFHLAARSNAVWLVLPPTTCERLASLAYSIRKLPSSTPSVFNDQRVIIYEFVYKFPSWRIPCFCLGNLWMRFFPDKFSFVSLSRDGKKFDSFQMLN